MTIFVESTRIVGGSSGPPGVGKTLTAEGIAETKRLPLYNVCQSSARLSSRLIMSRCAQET